MTTQGMCQGLRCSRGGKGLEEREKERERGSREGGRENRERERERESFLLQAIDLVYPPLII